MLQEIAKTFALVYFVIANMKIKFIVTLPLGNECRQYTAQELQDQWQMIIESEGRKLQSILLPPKQPEIQPSSTQFSGRGRQDVMHRSICKWTTRVDYNPDRYPMNLTVTVPEVNGAIPRNKSEMSLHAECSNIEGHYCENITREVKVLRKVTCANNCSLTTYVEAVEQINVGMTCVSRIRQPIHLTSICPWNMISYENNINANYTPNNNLCQSKFHHNCEPVLFHTALKPVIVGFTCARRNIVG